MNNDAKQQAERMLRQHTPTTARRVAAETALEFPRSSKGREFWCAVTEHVVRATNAGEVLP